MSEPCELCGRRVSVLTRHHLVPRMHHKKRRVLREFDRDELHHGIVLLCRSCHDFLHENFTEKTLEQELNTLAALAAHPAVARFVKWIARKPADFHSGSRTSRSKR